MRGALTGLPTRESRPAALAYPGWRLGLEGTRGLRLHGAAKFRYCLRIPSGV